MRGSIALPGHLDIARNDHARQLERGRLYWVDPTFTDLATIAATNLPTVTVHADLAPDETGLLAWAAPIGDTAAITWTTTDAAIHLVRYRNIGGGLDEQLLQTVRHDVGWLAPIATHVLPVGSRLNDKQPTGVAAVLATWLLIGQAAAETPAIEIDRPTRKRYARQNRRLPEVRLVRLRSSGQVSPGDPRRQSQTEGGHARREGLGYRSLAKPAVRASPRPTPTHLHPPVPTRSRRRADQAQHDRAHPQRRPAQAGRQLIVSRSSGGRGPIRGSGHRTAERDGETVSCSSHCSAR